MKEITNIKKETFKQNFKARIKATAIHLVFSLVLFAIFMFVVLKYWFPGPHFLYNGGWEGTRIMIVVDLVIGPLITFIIFNINKQKKEIVTDLLIILIIQIGLFIYGFYNTKIMRPVTLVLLEKGFARTTFNSLIKRQNKIFTKERKDSLNSTKNKPPFYYVETSSRSDESKKLMNIYGIRPGVHDTYATFMYEDPTKAITLSKIKKIATKSKQNLFKKDLYKKAILEFEKNNKGEFYFFEILLHSGDGVMVLDKKGYPVDYLAMHHYK